MKKIALEEHFSGPGFEHYLESVRGLFNHSAYLEIESLLPEFNEKRLTAMDNAEIKIAVLSQTAPGVQRETDAKLALTLARQSNDFLAKQISLCPERYRGFACLALQDPQEAARELKRCINEYEFVGALVNGHTNGVYLDDKQYWPFWQTVAELDVPVYLHPADSYDQPHVYSGRPELHGATYSWTCETAAHALRLVFGGVFDHFPSLKIILGHMGEALPFMLWRIDSRIDIGPFGDKTKRKPSEIIRDHFVITTSGACSNGPLLCSLSELGEESVMFSVDYPYEDTAAAVNFIENAPIPENVREKVCFRNAERVLKISVSSGIDD
ncbi:MAG: amidohydrolase family protein [Candidatus Melainabacteria bacterium]|nr:amidohydrolase family protein [Candidatus Melainabacteria bacterium]